MRRLILKCALLSALLVLPALAADDAEASIRTTFIQPWLKAVLANDPTAFNRFLHPKVRACINDQTREFFARGDTLNPKSATAKYLITKLGPLKPPAPLFGLPEDGFAYPVQPTYELQLEFEQTNTLVVRFLALSGGSWFVVAPCPNEKGMAFLREETIRGNEQKQHVAALVADLKDPLLSELREILKKGQTLDAIKRYQQATGQEDLTLAVMVVRAITPQ